MLRVSVAVAVAVSAAAAAGRRNMSNRRVAPAGKSPRCASAQPTARGTGSGPRAAAAAAPMCVLRVALVRDESRGRRKPQR